MRHNDQYIDNPQPPGYEDYHARRREAQQAKERDRVLDNRRSVRLQAMLSVKPKPKRRRK